MNNLTVSDVARDISHRTGITVPPQVISNLFYKRYLDDSRCPVVGRFRLIPADYIPTIEAALHRLGLVSPPEGKAELCEK